MKKLFLALLLSLCTAAIAYAQVASPWPNVIAPGTPYSFGNGPLKLRVISGTAYVFSSQGSGTGSTSGSSTTLTLTGTPTTPPCVGCKILGTGITTGTTVAAYNGTTTVTLSAAMTVAGGTAVTWGAACPTVRPASYIQASAGVDYYNLYTLARICALSPGAPSEVALILPYENAISLAGLGQIAADTVLGNWTGSAANVIANAMPSCPDTGSNHLNYVSGSGVVCGTAGGGGTPDLDAICTTQGAVLYRNASAWVCLTPGTLGDVLQSGGPAANPSWVPTTTGPGTVTDNAIVRWDGTDGCCIQNSTAIVSDTGNITGATYSGLTVSTTTGTLTVANAKTLSVSNSLTFAGTDATTMTFPSVSSNITRTVASGAKALATGAIGSGTCTSAQTDTATGTLTTDAVTASFNADPTAVTGYDAAVTGRLSIAVYPTADTVNFKVCNNTLASITPGAVTVNWRVVR